MGRTAAVAVVLASAIGGLLRAPPALAVPPNVTIDTWARDASFVVHARALSVEGKGGHFWRLAILKGRFPTCEFDATVAKATCVPHPGWENQPPFPAGSEVVLFLGPPKGAQYPVLGAGFAWLKVADQNRKEVLEAVGRVVEIEALPATGDRIRAYLDAAEHANGTLRSVACSVIRRELDGKDKAAPWEDRLVALLRSPVVDARLAALHSLQFSKSEKALPALLEAVKDEMERVRETASMALARYDTETTVRALIDAAKRPDMMTRVLTDLRGSRRPEAWAWLAGLLRSESPDIRMRALRALSAAVREGSSVVLEMGALLDDRSKEVRLATMEALRGSPRLETMQALLAFLRRTDLDPKERTAATLCLCRVDSGVKNHMAREIADLPSLLVLSLRVTADGGEEILLILALSNSKEARAVLERAAGGEFGDGLVKGAQLWLGRLKPRK